MVQGIKTVSFEEAVKVVKSGDRIQVFSAGNPSGAPYVTASDNTRTGIFNPVERLNCNIFIRKALLLMQSRNSKVYSSWNRILSATTYGKRLRTVGQTIFRYTSVKPRN